MPLEYLYLFCTAFPKSLFSRRMERLQTIFVKTAVRHFMACSSIEERRSYFKITSLTNLLVPQLLPERIYKIEGPALLAVI